MENNIDKNTEQRLTHQEIYGMGLKYSIEELANLVEPNSNKREAIAFEVGFHRGVAYADRITALFSAGETGQGDLSYRDAWRLIEDVYPEPTPITDVRWKDIAKLMVRFASLRTAGVKMPKHDEGINAATKASKERIGFLAGWNAAVQRIMELNQVGKIATNIGDTDLVIQRGDKVTIGVHLPDTAFVGGATAEDLKTFVEQNVVNLTQDAQEQTDSVILSPKSVKQIKGAIALARNYFGENDQTIQQQQLYSILNFALITIEKSLYCPTPPVTVTDEEIEAEAKRRYPNHWAADAIDRCRYVAFINSARWLREKMGGGKKSQPE